MSNISHQLFSGISTYAENPSGASTYLKPLLDYAVHHIPEEKHKETPLYIMATAGLRMLPERFVTKYMALDVELIMKKGFKQASTRRIFSCHTHV